MRCGVITSPEKSADGKIHCNQNFIIRTDPKNDDYALVEGLRRKVETWDPKDAETLELPDQETRRQMDLDPMFKVEKTVRDMSKEKSTKQRLAALEALQAEREDTYSLNCSLRRRNRQKRNEEQEKEKIRQREGPANFALPLLPLTVEDGEAAKRVNFRTDHEKIALSVRRAVVRAAPIFDERAGSSISSSSGSSTSHSRGNRSSSGCERPLSGSVVTKRPRSQSSDKTSISAAPALSVDSHGLAGNLTALVAKRRKLEQHAKMAKILKR